MKGETRQEQAIDKIFIVSVVTKGVISFFEMVAGVLALFVAPSAITAFIIALSEDELSEEPRSFIANHALHAAQTVHLPGQGFIAFYLMSRGLIKLLLIIAVLKKQYWAYPASIIVLLGFMAYQLYEILRGHSLILVVITLFDLIVVWSIWREYRILESRKGFSKESPLA